MISDTIFDFADQVYEEDNEIRQQIAKSDVAHFDETGVRINGGLKWVHVASNHTIPICILDLSAGKKA